MRRYLVIFVLLTLLLPPVAAALQSQSPPARDTVSYQRSEVRLLVVDGQLNNEDEESFLLTVEGWSPNGHLSIYLVGPKDERVSVVSNESRLQIKQDGVASFAVPYTLRGLYPGRWQLVVAGESGIHICTIVVPSTRRPGA